MFVDCANTEYSRDIEMMRGGYGDSYYRQLIECVRKYKGTKVDVPVLKSGGDTVEFINFTDDGIARNHAGSDTVYENYTARNIIERVAVTSNGKDMIFTIYTKDEITRRDNNCENPDCWMKMFVSADNGQTFFTVNDSPKSDTVTTVAKINSDDNFADTNHICDITYNYANNKMEFTVPVSAIGIAADRCEFTLWIKAADSSSAYQTPIDFYDLGCAAPIGGLYYTVKVTR